MANEKKFCGQCGQLMATWMRNCPECNAICDEPSPTLTQPAEESALEEISPEQAAAEMQGAVVRPVPAPQVQALANVQVFPERMKANRVLAERACASCAVMVEIGDDVWNCQACGNTMHLACRETAQKCGNVGCSSRAVHRPAAPTPRRLGDVPSGAAPASAAGGTKPCRFCGELILIKARKCRYCNEYLSDGDRTGNTQTVKAAAEDLNLSGSDMGIAAISIFIPCLGPVVGLIMALVYLSQNKPKWWKLLAFAIVGFVLHVAFIGAFGEE